MGYRRYAANYVEKGGFTVYFDTNGGDDMLPKTNVKWNDKVLDGVGTMFLEGHNFEGWQCNGINVDETTRYSDLVENDDTVRGVCPTTSKEVYCYI